MKTIEKIFILFSIIFLVTLVSVYSYRFINYYNLSKKIKTENKLYETVLNDRTNLYKINSSYYYKGNVDNNYIIYSGILWRIIKLENYNITMISEKPLYNLSFNGIYEESLINTQLSELYDKMDNRFIVDTTICIQKNDDVCINDYTNKLVLLNLDTYSEVGGIDSFINNGYYMYLADYDNGNYYITSEGKIDITNNDNMFGIKPIITISNTNFVSGNGNITNPYNLDKNATNLKEANIGNYILYKDKLYRIIENNENTRLILDESIEGYNTDYDQMLQTLKGEINETIDIADVNTLFINDLTDYVLKKHDDFNYIIKNNGIIYKDDNNLLNKVRPIIEINNDICIKGTGSKNNPYIVGCENNE